MARRVFFSFHYERDNWRVAQVRNSWVTKKNREVAGFWDAAKWEKVKRQGDRAIKNWIKKNLENTSVTVVLIGTQTYERKYVNYEIKQSYKRNNGLLGIHINNVKNRNGDICIKGRNPFNNFYIEKNKIKKHFSQLYSTYNWVLDNGYKNIGRWIEEAAKK